MQLVFWILGGVSQAKEEILEESFFKESISNPGPD
jgi:hypothetical protein